MPVNNRDSLRSPATLVTEAAVAVKVPPTSVRYDGEESIGKYATRFAVELNIGLQVVVVVIAVEDDVVAPIGEVELVIGTVFVEIVEVFIIVWTIKYVSVKESVLKSYLEKLFSSMNIYREQKDQVLRFSSGFESRK